MQHLACRRLCRAPCPLLLVLWRRASRPSIPCCPPRSTRATDKLAYHILAQWRLGPASHPPTPQPRMRMHPPPWTDPQPCTARSTRRQTPSLQSRGFQPLEGPAAPERGRQAVPSRGARRSPVTGLRPSIPHPPGRRPQARARGRVPERPPASCTCTCLPQRAPQPARHTSPACALRGRRARPLVAGQFWPTPSETAPQ